MTVDKLDELADFAAFTSDILTTEKWHGEGSFEQQDSLVFSSQIHLVNNKKWYLINAVSKDSALSQVTNASHNLLTLCLGTMFVSGVVLVLVIDRVYRPVLALKSLVLDLASGDGDLLTQRLEVKSQDDLGDIARGINQFIEQLNTMLLDVKNAVGHLSNDVIQLRENTEKNTGILNAHQTETNQVVVAMVQLGSSSQQVATSAIEAVRLVIHKIA